MEEYKYITLMEKPELREEAASGFNSKWGVPKEAYLECMDAYLNNETDYGWYLCLCGEKIVAGMGVIENDFHDSADIGFTSYSITEVNKDRYFSNADEMIKWIDCRFTVILLSSRESMFRKKHTLLLVYQHFSSFALISANASKNSLGLSSIVK